jgi:immune inhibitor A
MPLPSGTVPPELTQSFQAGLFDLPARHSGLSTSATQPVWVVPVILAAFSDQPFSTALYGNRTPGEYFETELFDTTGSTPTGSVFDYYRWVSNGRVRVVGKVVATVTLPNPKDYYANNSWGTGQFAPRNMYGFVTAALQAADPLVDWRPYDQDHDGYVDMLWVLHSGPGGEAPPVARDNLWSLTSRLTSWPSGERFKTRTSMPGAPALRISVDRFSIVPELSSSRPGQPQEIGVFCHEFGHALGLPDLYNTSTFGGASGVGPGNWNLMSTGGYGADGGSPEFPAHLGAWSLIYLGWRSVIRPTADADILQTPIADGDPIVEFWFQGESNPEHFLIENRQREGFDRRVPGQGLLVYRINEGIMSLFMPANQVNAGPVPGLQIIEADGRNDLNTGFNRGEASDVFPGPQNLQRSFTDTTNPSTRSYKGASTEIALEQIAPVGDAMHYQIRVRPPGWWPATQVSKGAFQPVLPSGPAARAILLSNGSMALATNEPVGGKPQVMLRTRSPGGTWSDPVEISSSPTTATDPTVVALPNSDDMVVLWSDTRNGAGEIYGRWRLNDRWTPERRLTDVPGDCRYPSAAADKTGRLYFAWLYSLNGQSMVQFTGRTGYVSRIGTPLEAAPATQFRRAAGRGGPRQPRSGVLVGSFRDRFWRAHPAPRGSLQ